MVDCGQYETLEQVRGALVDGKLMEAVVCPYDMQFGALTFGLFIYGTVMTALYVRTQSVVVPIVVTMVAGTVAISRVPSRAIQILALAMLLGISVAVLWLINRAQTMG